MANEQNLKPPFSKDDPNTARECQKKSAAARRRNLKKQKAFAETVRVIFETKVKDPKQLEIIRKSGMPAPKNPTYMDFFVASVMMRSIKKGSVDDIIKYMQIVGENLGEETSPALEKLDEILQGMKNNAETETKSETE